MATPHEPWRGAPANEPGRLFAGRAAGERPRYRPPAGVPSREGKSWRGALVSALLHLLVLLVIVSPWAAPMVLEEIQGAGGEGPAGGGGGGTRGSGGKPNMGVRERVQFVNVAPPPPAAKAPAPTPVPPVPVPPPPKPTPTPTPVPTPPQQQQPTPTPAPAQTPSASAGAAAPTPGTGGGTGSDGSAGSGPGSGGGVGAGIGTGRGSGIGPGTGGGNAEIYPPQATEVFIPPLPVPGKVRGTRLVAIFDVDSTGKVLAFDFTETRDGGYNRKLREVLGGFRFRPGTRADGTPVRAKGQIVYDL